MKFCAKCGKELFDEAVFCPSCGCPCGSSNIYQTQKKYCSKCGNEINPEAVVCVHCGCAVENAANTARNSIPQKREPTATDKSEALRTLSNRLKANGVIWICIALLQIAIAFFMVFGYRSTYYCFMFVVGAANFISAIMDFVYSDKIFKLPCGIVKKYEPLGGPLLTLIYNILFGGIVGIAGWIYYITGVRKYVVDRKDCFLAMENDYYSANGGVTEVK